MDQHNFSIQDAKQMDLVEYLEQLGYTASKIRNIDYWYRSPLRDGKTASFKVNKNLNCWFDFGLGEGGTIIDFGIKYFKCGVKEFLHKLKNSQPDFNQPSLSFHRKQVNSQVENDDKNKIKIIDVRSIESPELVGYLRSRFIDLEIAKKYCQEVDFKLYNRCHKAIGFKNDRGGFEFRNASFKGSSSPKFITFFGSANDHKNLVVFEGFFNFLSYKTALLSDQQLPESHANHLILNSLSFFEISKSLMEGHQSVRLFLDRDKAGIQYAQKALQLKTACMDSSYIYKGFKDYNDLLMDRPMTEEMAQRMGRRL